MEEPIIACDVSKGSSHIQGFIGLSKPIGNSFVVRHIRSDLKLIKELAKSLEKETKMKPVFVFEYTGIYHECISQYIHEIGLTQYAISPLESAKVRKSSIRVTKTDSKDCLNIATVYYTRKIREYLTDSSDVKALSREKKSIREQLVKQKCIYRRYLDLIWPCFDDFIDPFTITGMIIISTYKHPYVLKRRTVNMIAGVLENNGHYSKNRKYDLAYKIKDYSAECVSSVGLDSEYVKALIASYEKICNLMKEMESINERLDMCLRETVSYKLLKTIPGFGENTLLQVCAELGDYTRFKSAKQLVAYCGLDPSILQSGSNNGEHYSITRKGNSILRSSMYLVISQMLTKKEDNQITRFYFKKKSSGLSHKAAAIASCRKLVCCIYGMLNNGTCFETI